MASAPCARGHLWQRPPCARGLAGDGSPEQERSGGRRGQVWDWGRREAGREDKGYNRLFACLLIKNEYNKMCNVLHQITIVLECVVAKTSFLVAWSKSHLFLVSSSQFCPFVFAINLIFFMIL